MRCFALFLINPHFNGTHDVGAGAGPAAAGQQPAAPAGPNTQPLDMFNPQVCFNHMPRVFHF